MASRFWASPSKSAPPPVIKRRPIVECPLVFAPSISRVLTSSSTTCPSVDLNPSFSAHHESGSMVAVSPHQISSSPPLIPSTNPTPTPNNRIHFPLFAADLNPPVIDSTIVSSKHSHPGPLTLGPLSTDPAADITLMSNRILGMPSSETLTQTSLQKTIAAPEPVYPTMREALVSGNPLVRASIHKEISQALKESRSQQQRVRSINETEISHPPTCPDVSGTLDTSQPWASLFKKSPKNASSLSILFQVFEL